jgi:photosystem II stability/assembly factor-like uncharacterized protein
MKKLKQHLYLIFSIIFLITGCGYYSSDEDNMDGSIHTVVSSISPSDEVSSVSTDTSVLVSFSEEMNSSSVTTNTSDTTCSGSLQVSSDNFVTCVQMSSSPTGTNSNKTYTVTPSSRLPYGTNYKVSLTTEIDEASGSNKFDKYITPTGFTTINITVSSTSPADAATSASISESISITLSEPVDTSTITTNTSNTFCSGTFQVSSDNFSSCIQMNASPIASNSDKTFTITPSSDLKGNETYKIRVTTSIKDSSDNYLSTQYESSTGFTTLGLFVAVGGSGTILTSTNGIDWNSSSSGTSNELRGVTFGNNKFVIVGDKSTLTSSYGITWNYLSISQDLNAVAFGNNTFMAVGDYGQVGNITISNNGTSVYFARQNNKDLNAIAFGNYSVIISGSGPGAHYYVDHFFDNEGFTSYLSRGGGTDYGMTFGNNYFVLVGSGQDVQGLIMSGPESTSDGIAWSQGWVGSYALNGVTFGNNTFVSVGESGTILTSSDNGSSWTSRTSGTTERLHNIAYGDETFVVIGNSGTILTSSDNGTSWTSRTSSTTNNLIGITYSE